MAETAALINSDRAVELEPESESAVFHRRIEFHQARNPFSGFGNNSRNGFKLVTLNPTSEPYVAAGLSKKSEKSSEFCETGLDPELSFQISFRRIGAGLRNLGNTCFLNSVLQCLTYTEPLAAYLQSGKHQISCNTAGFCALCAIQKHVSRALQSTGSILEPKDLVYNLRRISRNFQNARQEDAHEYMVYLLESMHKCCLPSGVPSESPSAYEKSLVHKIFGGRLRSQVKCTQCSYCSNKFDPFLDLSLEIAKADSLQKALAHFTTKEKLDGGAKEYQCQQCRQKVVALKQLTIHKAPYVLTVHLKRFGSHAPSQKINKKVAFGPALDLKPFVTGPYDGDLNYTLYGVLVHTGWSTRSGHYYCFVRTSSGMWYALDDNEVFQVNERKVLEQKAYMLFYVRDRKNFCAKKTVNTIQKENMVMNGMRNEAYPKLNRELREKIKSGSNEKNLNGFFPVALPEGDAVVATLPEKTPSEKVSFPNTNGTMAVEKDIFPKKICAKKPVDTIQKENMVMNGMGNAEYSKLNLELREKIRNGSNEKKLNGSFSVALREGDAVVATLPEETPSEKISFPNTNGTMAVDNLGLKRDPSSEHSSVLPPTKDPLKEHSVMDINSVGHKGVSCSTVDGFGDSFNLGHAAKTITCNNGFGVVLEQSTSAVILANCEMPQDSLHMNESSDFIPMPSGCKDNGKENSSESAKKPPNRSVLRTSSGDTYRTEGTDSEMCASKIMPVGAIDEPSNKANPVLSSQQNSIEESQVGGSSVKTAGPTVEETRENGQLVDSVHSELLSGLPAITEPLPHGITKKKRPNLKVRRKLFKCQVGTTSLSSNIILGVGLCMRKKKHKRRKHHSMQKSSNVKHFLAGDDLPSKLGQSVTEESFPVLVDHYTHSQKKKAQCGSDGKNQNLSIQNMGGGDSISGDVIYIEFRERVVEDGTTVSSEKQPQRRQYAAQGSVNSEEHQRELRQTDVMSMLTRGLDETTVARWDEIDISVSQKSETRAAETAQIGYIGDEWDEEYDRGKRKKIRGSKISFGGPNLFQEIAMENTKRKRAKLERSNQPFRI